MQGQRFSIGLRAALAMFTVALFVTSAWAAAPEKVLRSFNVSGNDGFYPYAGLVFDAAGNLYGTTMEGGIHGQGMVFELTPQEGGGWTEKVLHSFNSTDGAYPYAGLIFDAAGNLYGTTVRGGIHDDGAVFELTPKEGGGWTEKVLHSFEHGTDGTYPFAGLIFDAAGNLYGTTYEGGIHGYGTVFELTRPRGRRLDGGGAAQLQPQRYGWGLSPSQPDHGCRWQSLQHHLRGRHSLAIGVRQCWLWDGVRGVATGRRRLDRDGAA